MIRKIIQSILIANIIVLAVIIIWMPARYQIVGTSMQPTLRDNCTVFVVKRNYIIHRQDIVIIQLHDDMLLGVHNIIKRVIGVPGDTVLLQNDKVFINGRELKEPYLHGGPTLRVEENLFITLKDNEYFVLGDNRLGSYDSREFGVVYRDEIVALHIVTW